MILIKIQLLSFNFEHFPVQVLDHKYPRDLEIAAMGGLTKAISTLPPLILLVTRCS